MTKDRVIVDAFSMKELVGSFFYRVEDSCRRCLTKSDLAKYAVFSVCELLPEKRLKQMIGRARYHDDVRTSEIDRRGRSHLSSSLAHLFFVLALAS